MAAVAGGGGRRCAAAAWLLLCGCSPTLDWRQNTAEGSGIVTSFPCRPDRHARGVDVAGAPVRLQMLVCSAGAATYAVSFYDAPDAKAVDAGLASLRAGMLSNIRAGPPRILAFKLAGVRPSDETVRLSADGRRPDGAVVRLEAAFFAQGLRVFQVAIVGPSLGEESVDPFFEGLRLPE